MAGREVRSVPKILLVYILFLIFVVALITLRFKNPVVTIFGIVVICSLLAGFVINFFLPLKSD